MRARNLVLVPILMAAAVALAGCAKKIDDAKAERFIAKIVTDRVGAKVKSVTCPTGLTAKKGRTFTCTVTGVDGSSGKTQVTGRSDQGAVRVTAPFIHVRELEQSIGADIAKQIGSEVELTCPEIIVGKKGGTFSCTAQSEKKKATVRVTQTDDQGHVRYDLEP